MTVYFVDGHSHQEMTRLFYNEGAQYNELVSYLLSQNYSNEASDAIANDFINNAYDDAIGYIENYR